MLRLFSRSIFVLLFACLTACSSIFIPQIGAVAPCQIQSVAQVEQAVRKSLTAQHWTILSAEDHAIQARKIFKEMQVIIDVAYGYRGFSIEYVSSKNMDYDAENNSIDPAYEKWTYNLSYAIQNHLTEQVKLNPSVKCLGKDVSA